MTSNADVSDLVHKFEVMMKQKDGTSRFVGLFILLDIVKRDQAAASKCWSVIDSSFLDKLILASTSDTQNENNNSDMLEQSKGTNSEEAQDLQGMGISILYAYIHDDGIVCSNKYLKRCDALMKAYHRGINIEETAAKVEEILERIAADKEGAIMMFSSPVFSTFAEKIVQNASDRGMAILSTVSIYAIMSESTTADLFHEGVSSIIRLAATRLDTEKPSFHPLVKYLRAVTSIIETDRLSQYLKDESIDRIRREVIKEFSKPARSKDLSDIFIILASLMRYQGHSFILKNDKELEDQRTLLLISSLCATEIRSCLAGLVTIEPSPDTQIQKLKVASCFDVVRIICLYLISEEDLPLKPEDILKLRENFGRAFIETIAYLRDRWDNSPLCPTYGIRMNKTISSTSGDADLLLQDPTIISGSQSLAIWLQEDESAHKEAYGIIDVLLGLSKECQRDELDYGSWLLPAISTLIDSENGLERFKEHNGSRVVLARLDRIAKRAASSTGQNNLMLRDAQIELDILRITTPDAAAKWEKANVALTARIEQAG